MDRSCPGKAPGGEMGKQRNRHEKGDGGNQGALITSVPVWCLAERVGFEPTVRLHVRLISSQVHSTALPPLRWAANDTGGRWRGQDGAAQATASAASASSASRSHTTLPALRRNCASRASCASRSPALT